MAKLSDENKAAATARDDGWRFIMDTANMTNLYVFTFSVIISLERIETLKLYLL